MFPKINIDLHGISENTKRVCDKCKNIGINVTAITKVFLADENIAECLVTGGATALGDSRIENLKNLGCFNMEKWLVRIPMESEIEDVIKYSDVSLNSEIKTIRLLNKEAYKQDTTHKVILMADLGDLREGYFSTDDLLSDVDKVLQMKNIELYGVGTNLTCFGAIIPRPETLQKLVKIKERIENDFDIELKVVSGGNSSSYTLVDRGEMIDGINNLRLGEVILLGNETSYGTPVEGLHHDNFILEAQIVELKEKPSVPIGEIGIDAFGNKPEFVNKGTMKRAIIAVGKQDVRIDGMTPVDSNIEILGASSDHTILDLTNVDKIYKLGDTVSFKLDYGATLAAMTSKYVEKEYVDI
ncbi:ornithine racemase Orr [Anaerofustis stercorihominis]|uniref:ornithine racemase Orr n=1 Tax=Anaerofustis stercorihominis TaxID=214853 RepID=UPI00214B4FA4|nr:ornithine racemase Orr [Anaerofustis stercorihominis]MCR2032111.1 ornithine racemase Orr [Anaerofustis stercorihominis]